MAVYPSRDGRGGGTAHRRDAAVGAGLVWFQADFAFPIEPEVVQDIRQLDWASLATDFYY